MELDQANTTTRHPVGQESWRGFNLPTSPFWCGAASPRRTRTGTRTGGRRPPHPEIQSRCSTKAYSGSSQLIYTSYTVARSGCLFAFGRAVLFFVKEESLFPSAAGKKDGWVKRPCNSYNLGLLYMNGEHRVCPPFFSRFHIPVCCFRA